MLGSPSDSYFVDLKYTESDMEKERSLRRGAIEAMLLNGKKLNDANLQLSDTRKVLQQMADDGCRSTFSDGTNRKVLTCHDRRCVMVKCYSCRAQDALRDSTDSGKEA